MSFPSRDTARPRPQVRRSSAMHVPGDRKGGGSSGLPASLISSPMLTPAPTPAPLRTGNPLDSSFGARPQPRAQMSPWALGGAPLLDIARGRNVSPLHSTLSAAHAASAGGSPFGVSSRRQSIALQSSCSGRLSLAESPAWCEPPVSAPVRAPPHWPLPTLTADPRSLASTMSLPGAAAANGVRLSPACAAADAQRTRRRSLAYERYPPLVSIFEAKHAARSSQLGEDNDARAPAATFRRISHPSSSSLQASSSLCLIGGDSQGCLIPEACVRRSPSAASLDSAFSAVSSDSSLSSSSSSASSYSYLFDTARPSTAIAPARPRSLGRKPSATQHGYGAIAADYSTGLSSVSNSMFLGAGDFSYSTMTSAICCRPPPAAAERTLLLPGDSSATLSADAEDGRVEMTTAKLLARELGCILSMSSYLVIGNALQAAISISQVASSGHLGSSELAAIGLAHIVVILTGYPVAFSVLGCLETCASQAFTSARPKLVGAYFVRAIQIQWVMGLALGVLWFSSEPMLSLAMGGASAEIITAAAEYLRWYFVPFMVFANLLCAKQVLYAQGVTYPLPYLTLLGALVTMGAQYLFVFSPLFKLGVRGIAIGNGTGYLAMLAATLVAIRKHNLARIWSPGFSAPWRPLLKLLPYSLILTLFSTGTSEIVTLAATQLGPHSLTVQSVLSALSRMLVICSSSVGVAALNRTGNLIGQQSPPRVARIAALVALASGLLCALLAVAILLAAPETWIRIFTNDHMVISDVQTLLPIVALAFVAQTSSFIGSQLLTAQGRQALAVRIKCIALYVVGLPLGYWWSVACGYGLAGLWAAVAVGQLCTAVVEAIVVLRTNWSQLIDKCASSIVHGGPGLM
ncbi:ethionine resistance protein [Coemansia thaxteri]|uniref:Ethionine resistance protein n=1 Tax=Coemansia thaxteri TaxID=2663907 RepID=A0A9W8BFE1_9FUNG|nr:ethionine resistance protein [Coemansia thaxteri]KAJ2008967.1 ethionine resistance protein [Coemansia thaxteri]KAJ2473596.1 ethionine resistance protein [Coemansia sp. RSA 2322]KAJ2485883.1 ethionine resistance protein [Coemansia sp. RSA 2320]